VPTVSVIIPTCDRVDSLKKSVSGVLHQTYHDFEIVVVNDGSTDGTSAFLSTIQDPRFRYFEFTANRGGSIARNEGIKNARGDIIAFLDDDDWWEPVKLEQQIRTIQRENVGLCYTGVTKRTLRGKLNRYIFMSPRFTNLYKSIMFVNFFGTTSSIMVKKTVLEQTGGFDPALPALQDWDLYIRLLKNGCTIYGIDEPLVHYNIINNAQNVSGSFSRFKTAAVYLQEKYRDFEFYNLFKKRLVYVECLRYFKSRSFLLDAIEYYLRHSFK
jgi:glycosyltransferase involved in cell wall biosynthesis